MFPDGEYQYRNEACSAFAHLLSARVRRDFGVEPLNIWCSKSKISEDLFREMKQNAPAALRNVSSGEKLPSMIVARIPGDNAAGVDYLMWREHHVAMCLDLPVYQNSAKRERLVFDPVLFAEPVREKDWINALNTSPTYIQYTPAEHDSRELETKARLMLRKIQRDVPIKLLKSPLMILAAREKEKWRRSPPICLRLSLTAEQYAVRLFCLENNSFLSCFPRHVSFPVPLGLSHSLLSLPGFFSFVIPVLFLSCHSRVEHGNLEKRRCKIAFSLYNHFCRWKWLCQRRSIQTPYEKPIR